MTIVIPYGSSITSFVSNELIAPAGQVVPYAGVRQPLGWLFCDGSTINRLTYPRLFAALTESYAAAVTTSGSDTVTGLTGLTSAIVGWGVSGPNIPSGAFVSATGLTSTAFRMVNASGASITASGTGTVAISLGPYGFTGADNTTTFQLPDMRGRMPVGLGTNASVAALGASEGAALAARQPRHLHQVSASVTSNAASSATSNATSNASVSVTSNQGAFTAPGNAPGAFIMGNGNGWNLGAAGLPFSVSTNVATNVATSVTTNVVSNISATVGPQANVPSDTAAFLTLNYVIKT